MDQGCPSARLTVLYEEAMRSHRVAILIGLAFGACGVAPTGPGVMVLPGSGKTLTQFETDDATCRRWALRQIGVMPNEAEAKTTASGAVAATVLGSAAGAAIDSAAANPATGAAVGSGVGLPGGTAVGADLGGREEWSGQDRYDVAYLQCMYVSGNQIPVPRGTMSGAVPEEWEEPAIPPPPAGKPPPPPPGLAS